MTHYLILGPTCGRDWRKRFHCDCGQCRELPEDWENLDFPVFFTAYGDARKAEPWLIASPMCGRDKNGIFRCVCGRCRRKPEKRQNGYYNSYYRGYSRDDTEADGKDVTVTL